MPAKTIIFCADGTWNSPGNDKDELNKDTNVYKIFKYLQGDASGDLADQEKDYVVGGNLVQCAKYINGVGNGGTHFEQVLGGALGTGLVVRIVRGYTYISRQYNPGDKIVLLGFSRGAYTVRALAAFILAKGLLPNDPPLDKDDAHRRGTKVWFDYRQGEKRDITSLAATLTNLGAFIKAQGANTDGLRAVANIEAVAVWDTVGALGIPQLTAHGFADAFQFADNKLDPRVKTGRQALALHEQRNAFQPCVWEPRDGIKQLRFIGAHADVGGGYLPKESGLSDIALDWMMGELSQLGVQFDGGQLARLQPNFGAAMHTPWKDQPFVQDLLNGARKWPIPVADHPSVGERSKAGINP